MWRGSSTPRTGFRSRCSTSPCKQSTQPPAAAAGTYSCPGLRCPPACCSLSRAPSWTRCCVAFCSPLSNKRAMSNPPQVSWHQLAHCLAASAKEAATSAVAAESDAAEDALQNTMEMLLTELGAALVPITDSAPADAAAAAGECCGPSQVPGASASDPVCCREMLSPTLFGDDHVAAIHSLRYAVEGLPLFAIAQRAWSRVRVSHASPFNPPMCVTNASSFVKCTALT